jgi:hypothetical protein
MTRVVSSSVPTVIGSVIVMSALKSGKKNDRSFINTFFYASLCSKDYLKKEYMLEGVGQF